MGPRPAGTDWRAVTRAVLEKCPGLKPWDVPLLTLAEVATLLQGDKGDDLSDEDLRALARKYRGMTCLQRLREAKAGTL